MYITTYIPRTLATKRHRRMASVRYTCYQNTFIYMCVCVYKLS